MHAGDFHSALCTAVVTALSVPRRHIILSTTCCSGHETALRLASHANKMPMFHIVTDGYNHDNYITVDMFRSLFITIAKTACTQSQGCMIVITDPHKLHSDAWTTMLHYIDIICNAGDLSLEDDFVQLFSTDAQAAILELMSAGARSAGVLNKPQNLWRCLADRLSRTIHFIIVCQPASEAVDLLSNTNVVNMMLQEPNALPCMPVSLHIQASRHAALYRYFVPIVFDVSDQEELMTIARTTLSALHEDNVEDIIHHMITIHNSAVNILTIDTGGCMVDIRQLFVNYVLTFKEFMSRSIKGLSQYVVGLETVIGKITSIAAFRDRVKLELSSEKLQCDSSSMRSTDVFGM